MLNRVFWNVEIIYTSSTFTHGQKGKLEITSSKYDQNKKRNKGKRCYRTNSRLHSAGSLLCCTGSPLCPDPDPARMKKEVRRRCLLFSARSMPASVHAGPLLDQRYIQLNYLPQGILGSLLGRTTNSHGWAVQHTAAWAIQSNRNRRARRQLIR
jgi:hypothetical protein